MDFEPIPSAMLAPSSQPGSLHRFCYMSETYTAEHRPVRKDALVYLPHGYHEHPEVSYPVLYLMHGGGGDSDEFFGGLEAKTALKNVLDNGIAEGRMQPAIVVAPTFLVPGVEGARHVLDIAQNLTHRFPQELKNDLIPAIDKAFRTIADRKARAFGGFSMGGETTWSVLADCSCEVYTVLPLSGDYWAVAVKGGKDHTEATVDALISRIQQSGAMPCDYRILAFTGDQDIAYEALDPMIHAMQQRTDWFGGECLSYCLKQNGWHTYNDCFEYIHLAMPRLFAIN